MTQIHIEIQNEIITQKGVHAIIDFYHTLASHEQNFSHSMAFVTGIESPFLNVFFDNRIQKTDSTELLKDVERYFNRHQVPWAWYITPAVTENDLVHQGLVLVEEAPALYFDLHNPIPKMKSDFITIEEADEDDDLHKWKQPINEGFQVEDDDTYRQLNADILNKGEKKLRHFIAHYKNEIAAAGTLFLSQDTAMIHNIATKPAFKKCGLGTTLTLHMLEIAKKIGFQHCYLDSTQEGFTLYKKIGFKVYCSTLIYCKPAFKEFY